MIRVDNGWRVVAAPLAKRSFLVRHDGNPHRY